MIKIPVALELKQVGEVGKTQLVVPYEDFEYLGRMVRFAAPLIIDAQYVYDGKGFNISGKVSTVLHSECALCTKEFDEEFNTEFDERFEKEASEDEEIYRFVGEELDISQMVADIIVLNLQSYSVCKEDCKGLCPICGCDLNITQCSCKREEESKNPFSALGKLLNENEEV